MRGWSLGIGRIFGVELRLAIFFLLILPVLMTLGAIEDGSGARGFLLWLLFLAAVAVRETGRALVLAFFGRAPSRLVLLPTGAVPAVSDFTANAVRGDRTIALAGPVSNFLVGVTLAMLMYSVTAQVNLFERPWVTPGHLLRSAIWTQILLGGLNLLPAFPLDAGALLRRQFIAIRGLSGGTRAASGISQATGWLLILLGAAFSNLWVMLMGGCVVIAAQGDAQSARAEQAASSVTMADIMLQNFAVLAASDTLEDALTTSVHSLQDAFPVVRGQTLVGAVTRSAIVDALRTDGNGYVQGVMARQVPVCTGADLLVSTLRSGPVTTGTRLIAVVDNDALVGIVTTETLGQSMSLVGQARRLLHRRTERRASRGRGDQ